MLLPALSGAFGDHQDAIRVGDQRASRGTGLSAATALADRIAGCGVAAVWATPSMETVVAVVASLIAGVPLVPVPPDSGPAELKYVLSDAAAALLLVPAGEVPSRADVPVPVAPVDLRLRAPAAQHLHQPPLGQPALLAEPQPWQLGVLVAGAGAQVAVQRLAGLAAER